MGRFWRGHEPHLVILDETMPPVSDPKNWPPNLPPEPRQGLLPEELPSFDPDDRPVQCRLGHRLPLDWWGEPCPHCPPPPPPPQVDRSMIGYIEGRPKRRVKWIRKWWQRQITCDHCGRAYCDNAACRVR